MRSHARKGTVKKEREEIAWMFRFKLFSTAEELVSIGTAAHLLEHITEWAEERNLQIGGGYNAARDTDGATGTGPAYPPQHRAWRFDFGLENDGPGPLSEGAARKLLSHLHDWAREHDLSIAGVTSTGSRRWGSGSTTR